MLVKVNRSFLIGNGIVAKEGQVINVTDTRARELEKMGLAAPTLGGKANVNDAFLQRQDGGKTGEEELPPSLPVDPPPLLSKSISKPRARKRKSSR